MHPVLSLKEAAALDHHLIAEYGLFESSLIDNAAREAFEATKDLIHGRVLVMVGPGNNGSDGLSLLGILLDNGFSPDVFFLYEKGNDENLRRRKALHSSIKIAESTSGYDTVYDALFGFSFHGEADERTKNAIEGANSASTVIALDVPSCGLVMADATVVFMALKDVLYEPTMRKQAGRIILANPGFPDEELNRSDTGFYLLEDADSALHGFSVTDYKNTRGHLALIGGSDRYTGAPRLAARAAFFSGAGLVTIVTDSDKIREDNPAVIIASPLSDLSFASAIAIGPGWDNGDSLLFEKAIGSGKNIVIDADGLKFAPGHAFGYRAVITPHIGEYRRLMASLAVPDGLGSPSGLSSSLRTLSRKLECIVVLKSSVVWITDGERILVYDGSNPSLGVAGSGDVLTGIIGALLAGGYSPLDAAVGGVILHQRAGRKAREDYGYYSAEELILEVGRCR